MTAVQCPNCAKKLKVADKLAGKRIRCLGCGKPVPIPSGVSAPTRNAPVPPRPAPTLADRPRDGDSDPSGKATFSSGFFHDHTISGAAPAPPPKQLVDFLAPPQSDGELGRLGPYRVLKVLGHGGMGVVFLAEDAKLKRKVALKAMLPSIARNEISASRFVREAQAMAQVKHKHVATIHQVDEDRGVPYLAMEFLTGEPLDALLKRQPILPIPDVLRIGREIAEGLAAAHKCGLIHRDIKPGNVWLESDDNQQATRSRAPEVKILDFGLARSGETDVQLTQSGAIVGTPAYMAPEQARGVAVDARCDLFSLGVVLYRMATGRLPFKGIDTVSTLMAIASDQPAPPQTINVEIPAELSELILKLLAKDPAERYSSALDVALALEAIESNSARRMATMGPPKQLPIARPVSGALTTMAADPNEPSSPFSFKSSKGQLVSLSATEHAGPARSARKKPPRANMPWKWIAAGFVGIAVVLLAWQGIVHFLPSDGPEAKLAAKDKKAVADPKKKKDEIPSVALPEPEMAIAPFDARLAAKHQKAWADYAKQSVVEKSPTGVEMVLIPPGGGKMSQPWRLGKYEVTQAQFARVMGWNPSYCQGEKAKGADPKTLPVENVRWYVAVEFCNELSKLEKLKPYYEIKVDKREGEEIVEAEVKILGGDGYRLPTEKEWEYAARAGSDTRFGYSDREEDLDKYGWYEKNSDGRSHKVGEKLPNGFGLYDMHGNAYEWCWDLEHPGAPDRVSRGGGWFTPTENCSVGHRYAAPPGPQQLHRPALGPSSVPGPAVAMSAYGAERRRSRRHREARHAVVASDS